MAESEHSLTEHLLAYAKGRVSRQLLADWCRFQVQSSQSRHPLLNYLAQPQPQLALALLEGFRELESELKTLEMSQRLILQRCLGEILMEAAFLCLRQGLHPAAEGLLLKAIDLAPDQVKSWSFLAELQLFTQRPQAAKATLEQCLELFPNHLPGQILWARLALEQGQGEQARQRFLKLADKFSAHFDIWLGLGNLNLALGYETEALQAFERALSLSPEHPGLWNNLGQLYQRQQKQDLAAQAYLKALELEPRQVEAWNNLAALELDRGNASAVRQGLSQALQLAPTYAPAWINLGILEALSGRDTQAHEAFERARELNPMLPEPWLEEASLLVKRKHYLAASQLMDQALQALPQVDQLKWMQSRLLGFMHQSQRAHQLGQAALLNQSQMPRQALSAGQRFRQLQLELGWTESHFLDSPEQTQDYLDHVQALLEQQPEQTFEIPALNSELRYLPELLWNLAYVGAQEHLGLRQRFASLFRQPQTLIERKRRLRPGERLRLGVLVTPGHEGIFLAAGLPLIEALADQHNPLLAEAGLQAAFEISLIGDAQRLGNHPQLSLLRLPTNLQAAAARIQEAEFDLLYFWEAGSDSLNYFLPFYRLAPVQFASWGMPFSSGIPQLDYFISSALIEGPQSQSHYSEKLLLHPQLPGYAKDPREIAADPHPREILKLPLKAKLYVCLQNPLKYCQDFVQALKNIQLQDPDAHLVLLGSESPWIQARLQQALQECDPERLHWVQPPISYARFLNYFVVADVVLDTSKYSGGQTSDEALLLGVPLISLPGPSTRGRYAEAKLRLIGCQEALAQDWQDYVSKALEMAHPGPLRNRVLSCLETHKGALLNNPRIPLEFARLLKQMASGIEG